MSHFSSSVHSRQLAYAESRDSNDPKDKHPLKWAHFVITGFVLYQTLKNKGFCADQMNCNVIECNCSDFHVFFFFFKQLLETEDYIIIIAT